MKNLLDLLKRNQIKYSYAGSIGKKFKAFDYSANKETDAAIEKGDILVSAYQPQSRFVQVLFEPDSKAIDSISYDLTAWALPYAYNLKAFAIADQIKPLEGEITEDKIANEKSTGKPYGYLVNFGGFNEIKFISGLHNKSIKFRYSLKAFVMNGQNFNRGSLIISRGDNKLLESKFDDLVATVANENQVKLNVVTTGMVDSGKDLGSDYSPLMKKPTIAILCGEGTSTSAVGELWYYFEKELVYPVTLINTSYAASVDFKKYDVVILTSGNYQKLKDTIFNYVKNGGRIIAFETAISLFAADKTTSLFKSIETRTAEQKLAEKNVKSSDTTLLRKFENERRYSLTERSAGSIYKVRLDVTNPYAFGLGNEWFILKRTAGYPFLTTGRNIGYILDKEPVSGFAGYKWKEKISNTLVIGTERIGTGEVVYITDNPYFRAFWKSGRVLIGNTIFR
jgi:hypothetical protein